MANNDSSPKTLVARLHAEAMRLGISIATPTTDEGMNALLDELFAVTTRLAQAPARDAKDLSMKLDGLCQINQAGPGRSAAIKASHTAS